MRIKLSRRVSLFTSGLARLVFVPNGHMYVARGTERQSWVALLASIADFIRQPKRCKPAAMWIPAIVRSRMDWRACARSFVGTQGRQTGLFCGCTWRLRRFYDLFCTLRLTRHWCNATRRLKYGRHYNSILTPISTARYRACGAASINRTRLSLCYFVTFIIVISFLYDD